MRARVGLASPEEMVGQAAHDFASAVCASGDVVLSCPRRRDGAPAVPARWLTRLEMFLAGRATKLPVHPAVGWARALDQPAGPPEPVKPPAPCPAVALRPRRLSVTEIETWLRDPYAIYARHVLRLAALEPLEQETDAADYGSLVHAGLHRFLEENGVRWPTNAVARLREHLVGAMQRAGLREALRNWWAPRLERIADWVAETETRRRSEVSLDAVWSEVPGRWELVGLAGRSRWSAGRTGSSGGRTERSRSWTTRPGIRRGLRRSRPGWRRNCRWRPRWWAPGRSGPNGRVEVAELSYWHLTGGYVPGQVLTLFKRDRALLAASVAEAAQALGALIDAFDHPGRCYLSQPHPGRAPRFSEFGQLARVAEWAAAGEDG